MTEGRLSGRRALITGAADGIGLGIARRFAAEGAHVVMADFDHEKAVAEARALTDAGHTAEAVFVDVTDKGAVATMMSTAAPVDILVNNAYRGNGVARIEKKSDEDFLSALGMNLWGVKWAMEAALPHMKTQGWGRVINISSVEGKHGKAVFTPYTAAKHAINGFTKSVAREVGTEGVTVNAICPGLVITDIIRSNGPATAETMGMTFDEMVAMFSRDSALQRPVTVEEVAALAVLLASDAGSGITGAIMSVDGGTAQY